MESSENFSFIKLTECPSNRKNCWRKQRLCEATRAHTLGRYYPLGLWCNRRCVLICWLPAKQSDWKTECIFTINCPSSDDARLASNGVRRPSPFAVSGIENLNCFGIGSLLVLDTWVSQICILKKGEFCNVFTVSGTSGSANISFPMMVMIPVFVGHALRVYPKFL